MGDLYSKKSEKLQDDIWSDIEEPPVNGTRMYYYAVIVHGSSHYYFGGYDGGDLNSILRLQSGSWKWSNVGQMKSYMHRLGHAVILVSKTFMVVGGDGTQKNEACLLNNGQFSCTELSSSLDSYIYYPILLSVADNFGNC